MVMTFVITNKENPAVNAHHPAALTWFQHHRATGRGGIQAQFIGCSMTDTLVLDALPLFPLELVLFPGGSCLCGFLRCGTSTW
jgi:hypothetical protein